MPVIYSAQTLPGDFLSSMHFSMPTFEAKCWYMDDNLKMRTVDACTLIYDRKTFLKIAIGR